MKIAIEELAGCSGCTIAVLDLHESLLNVLEHAEIVYSPVVMDVKEPAEGIDIAFVTGAVRNKENEERLHMLRKRSKTLVALGTCACYGGISGLSMLSSREALFNYVYREVDTVGPNNKVPTDVPPFLYRAFAVGDLVHTDYYIPGCPPKEERLKQILLPMITGGNCGALTAPAQAPSWSKTSIQVGSGRARMISPRRAADCFSGRPTAIPPTEPSCG